MIKVIEFICIFALVYWLLFIYPKKPLFKKKPPATSTPTPPPQVETVKMVACSFCKVQLPISDSYVHQERYFCSLRHFNTIDSQGWLGCAKQTRSENYDQRPHGILIDTVVMHHISLPPGAFGGSAVEDFFTSQLSVQDHPYYEQIADLQVSAHFYIPRDGQLVQFVSTHYRAWHAGASQLFGRERVNDFSIGIELEGTGELAFESVQYQTLAKLIAAIKQQYDIQSFVGHSDIAPDRKTDPGKHFDWEYVSQLSKISEKNLPFGIKSR